MKKTLAIVLALVMVLCMIPAMSAGTEYKYDVTSQSYKVEGYAVNTNADGSFKNWKQLDSGTAATKKTNSATIKYSWTDLETNNSITTGKWSEDAVMVVVDLIGFKTGLDATKTKVFVDGKQVNPGDDLTIYKGGLGYHATSGTVTIPVEVTKAGFKDTMEVVLTGEYTEGTGETEATIKYTETAVMTLTFQNTDEYKVAKLATVTDIKSDNAKKLYAYIVGDKIYLDFTYENAKGLNAAENLKVTFADENGKPFTSTTWAYDTREKGPSGFEVKAGTNTTVKNFSTGYKDWKGDAVKLESSEANYIIGTIEDKKEVQFLLETASTLYETKKFDVVVRTGVAAADPKGIYFAETVKTIKVGEKYSPVVMGVATGKPVAVEKINIGKYSDELVLDTINDTTIIGVKEGVAYITAEYTYIKTDDKPVKYDTNAMKIVVTEGESIPPAVPTTTTYVVSCRNLNVRKGAGTSYAKVGMIHRGDAVEVVEFVGGWAKLANGNYVCAKYIYKK